MIGNKLFLAMILVFFGQKVHSAFTSDFGKWLSVHYGDDVRRNLERLDLGDNGSFGGNKNASQVARKQPVIFVDGVSSTAGDKIKNSADYFKKHANYENYELYGTTYSNGAQYKMDCHFVKLVRALIVDVIGYSLGVPISRKAIMGGRCVDTGEDLGSSLTKFVDTGEDLGSSLTKFVDTFVGIAGPNHGISLQVGALSLPGCLFSAIPVCNQITGLYSGNCPHESSFLQYGSTNVFFVG
uniref:Lipase n=1 Tax=Rhabditophanes sp. KR3021 TaxID=114890 RepID=A0AC35TWH4_9BILA